MGTAAVLRFSFALLVALFAAQVSLPHAHVAAAHDHEICSGDLGDRPSPADTQIDECPVCRAGTHARVLALCAASEALPYAHRNRLAPALPAALAEPPRGDEAARAPPALSA